MKLHERFGVNPDISTSEFLKILEEKKEIIFRSYGEEVFDSGVGAYQFFYKYCAVAIGACAMIYLVSAISSDGEYHHW